MAGMTHAVLERAIQGEMPKSFYVPWIPKFTGGDRSRYEKAKEDGFLVLKNRHDAIQNAWFKWCELERRPWIVLHRSKTYDLVRMASWSAEDVSEEGMARIRELVLATWRQRGRRPEAGGWTNVKVPSGRGETLCRQLAALVAEHPDRRSAKGKRKAARRKENSL